MSPLPQTPSLKLEQTLAEAPHCHAEGRLPDAERLYAMVLAARPDHFDALQMLAVVNDLLPLKVPVFG